MGPETWAAIAAAGAAIAAAAVALVALPFTVRAANAAKAQTDLQRDIALEATQPYVWADVWLHEAQGVALNLVVGNAGPTIANDVRVTVSPDLPVSVNKPEHKERAFSRLRDGIRTLGPGRRAEWLLGTAHELLADDGPQQHTITINALGPNGPIPTLSYVIDLADLREANSSPSGSLHQLTKAVKDIEKKMPK